MLETRNLFIDLLEMSRHVLDSPNLMMALADSGLKTEGNNLDSKVDNNIVSNHSDLFSIKFDQFLIKIDLYSINRSKRSIKRSKKSLKRLIKSNLI